MNDYTPKILDILAYQQVITNQGENYTGEKDWALNKLKSLIAESIAQAVAEERARVVGEIEKSCPKIELKYRKDFEGMSLPEIANYRTQLGAYLAVQEQIDYLKAEKAIIEKI